MGYGLLNYLVHVCIDLATCRRVLVALLNIQMIPSLYFVSLVQTILNCINRRSVMGNLFKNVVVRRLSDVFRIER